jgi:hypothetical protein
MEGMDPRLQPLIQRASDVKTYRPTLPRIIDEDFTNHTCRNQDQVSRPGQHTDLLADLVIYEG